MYKLMRQQAIFTCICQSWRKSAQSIVWNQK